MTAPSKLGKKWSAALGTACVAVALVIAGCGGSSNSPSHAAAPYGAPAANSTATTTAPTASKPDAGIAQHNGGDQDPDNNGGPNDGDGAL